MKTLALVALAAAAPLGTSSYPIATEPRQLKESRVAPGEKAYVAGVRAVPSESTFCGGLLITPTKVLSNALCAGWAKYITVGENLARNLTTGEIHYITKKSVHPQSKYPAYNVVIFELERASKFTPVALADRDVSYYAGAIASTFSWGALGLTPNPLVRTTSTIRSDAECAKLGESLDKSRFCAGGSTTAPVCSSGPSGGPIVIERAGQPDVALGAVVRGEGCSDDAGKSGASVPGVYSRTYLVKIWILEIAPGAKFVYMTGLSGFA